MWHVHQIRLLNKTIKTFVHCCVHRAGFTVVGGPRGNQKVEAPMTILFVFVLTSYNNYKKTNNSQFL
jgi:hypothetical protein